MADSSRPTARHPPRYYVAYGEQSAPSYQRVTESSNGDGCSLYRGIARLRLGDPSQYPHIRDTAQRFAISVESNSEHPLHAQYLAHEAAFKRRTGGMGLFAALECPDLREPNSHLLWIIASALDVQIKVYKSISLGGEVDQLRMTAGSPKAATSVALLETKSSGPFAVRYSSLLPDESGKEVIEYLQSTKQTMERQTKLPASEQTFGGLPMNQVSYAQTKTQVTKRCPDGVTTIKCHNGFRTDSKLKDLDRISALNRMDTHVAVVNDPHHVKPALEMLRKTLELAPNQQRDVKISSTCKSGAMLPHCAADAEFIKLPRHLADGKSKREVDRLVADGQVEELCSVLTISVGRHFSMIVNVYHMLENANADTVPALELLFKETIFNKKIMKLWWNYQQDFLVLENTIAHMYQGTARQPFWYEPHPCQRLSPRMVTPTFRIRSPHLNGTRPDDMKFSIGERQCDLHIPSTNALDMSCPCRLGNIDIAALLDHLTRLHLFSRPKRPWTGHRNNFKYDDLLRLMLDHEVHLLPILQYMKDEPCRSPLGKDRYFQSLGQPGMEKDDNAIGYVIMDVIGINLIFEQLFARGDGQFIAKQLYSWHSEQSDASKKVAMRVTLARQPSRLGAVDGITLIEDNPKPFKRDAFWKDYFELWSFGPQEMHSSLVATGSLTPLQHDQRVAINRKLVTEGEQPRIAAPNSSTYTPLSDENQGDLDHQRMLLLRETLDPLALWLPLTCAEMFEEDLSFAAPIVRANSTHSEALADFLRSPHCKNASPPLGFGAAPGAEGGLPAFLGRVPGAGLENSRAIFEAFQVKTGRSGEHLRGPRWLPPLGGSKNTPDPQPDYTALAKAAIDREKNHWGGNMWTAKESARRRLQYTISQEERINKEQGLPGIIDYTDLFDPEGREYRRRIESTPEWNRPQLPERPMLRADEPWRSTTTEIMKALDNVIPQQTEAEYLAWYEANGPHRVRAGVSYSKALGSKAQKKG